MAERHVAFGFGFFHGFLEFDTRQAVEAVALDYGGIDFFAEEDVLERDLDGGGAGAGRTGDRNDGMFLGHAGTP